ncbi:MAG: PIG-L family deacetylase [Pyrinomonadaceae bacterium]
MNTDSKVKSKKVKGKSKILSFTRCVFTFYFLLFTFYFFYLPLPETSAQVRPVYDYGAIGLGQLLKRLNNTKSVMHIGAHPDDEDSGLLAYLARGENARTAYLSLTRGDGGQNIIGSELFESLGVIRTEELLQARRLDGAEQFFTRAYDYGFSKTLEEAKQKWNEKVILCDTVRAIRRFRPLVVISRFSGTPADGHGQHQYAGYISPLAVKAAADMNQCIDSGMPWQVLKFYVSRGFRSTAEPTLKINTGEYDFLLGRSYFEIAMEGRSQHKTQEQGGLELRGDQFSGLNLVESKVPKVENEQSVFDGIDTSIDTGIKATQKTNLFSEDEEKAELSKISTAAKRALKEYEPNNPQKIIPILLEGLKAIGKIQRSGAYPTPDVSQKGLEFFEAIQRASGIRIDALANRETVAPDENFLITVKVFLPKTINAEIKSISLRIPDDWAEYEISEPKETNQNFFRRENANRTSYFTVKVGREAKPTEPFWLKKQRQGDLFNVQPPFDNQNLPFQPSTVFADAKLEIEGTEFYFKQPVQYRFADDIRGEVRRDLNVVPKISLNLDQDLLIVPQSDKAQIRRIVLSLTNNSSSAIGGEARLNVPKELKVSPATANFNFKNKGEKTSVAFDVTIPAKFKIGDFELSAQANANGETFTQTMNEIAYPHIQTHRFYTEAKTQIKVLDLKTAPAKIGYIMGSGDEVPEAIRQMNLNVELLSETELTNGDLSKFDTIVVGIRAFQVRQDLIANNQRLIDYVKGGGNLIVQYQRPDYENLLPFPAKPGARVADENAKITILEPDNPIFNFPNRITDADFTGWVQERNLYAFTTFDQNYKPLLEAHDAGEAENKGGLVVANIGKGKYIYCSYAFFRQLPAGVTGAYRLFANLLSQQNAK